MVMSAGKLRRTAHCAQQEVRQQLDVIWSVLQRVPLALVVTVEAPDPFGPGTDCVELVKLPV